MMDENSSINQEKILSKIRKNIRDFKVEYKLNFGRNGWFYICFKKRGGVKKIMKIMTKSKLIENKLVDRISDEIGEYQMLSKSGYFPQMFGIDLEDKQYLAYIFDFYSGGTLANLLKVKKAFTLEQTRFYSANIIKIFDLLHKNNYIYRDLKLENILIQSHGYLMPIDIYCIKRLKQGELTYSLCGKPNYLAPEMILSKGYGKSVDWWTLGIMIYLMLVGRDPFYSNDPMLVYQNIITGRLRFPSIIDKYNILIFRDAKNLIKHLLNPDPKKRYGCLKNGAIDIIEHRMFNDFDWEKFEKEKMDAPFIPTVEYDDDLIGYFPNGIAKEEIVDEKEKKERDIRRKSTVKNKRGEFELEALNIDPDAKDVEPESDPFLNW